MKKLLLLFILIALGYNLNAAELEQGDGYHVIQASGTLHLTCEGYVNGRYIVDHSNLYCRDSRVDTASHSRFLSDNAISDQVRLTNLNSGYSKIKKFYPSKGFSKSFNLLVRSLTQRPLLLSGLNTIKYEMLDDSRANETGLFDVYVRLERRNCYPQYYRYFNLSACRGNNSYMCRDYFIRNGCLR